MYQVLARGAVLIGLATSVSATQAAADVMPPYLFTSAQLNGEGPSGAGGSNAPGQTSLFTSVGSASGFAEATATVSGAVLLTGFARANSGQTNDGASTFAEVAYQIAVTGSPGIAVPVDYLANLSAAGSYSAGPFTSFFGYAAFAITPTAQLGTEYSACLENGYTGLGCDTPTLMITGTTYLRAGDVASISEVVQTTAVDGATASARADPYFFIDPIFLADNPGYSLEISEGVANAPIAAGIPEPASWAMMLIGFGGLGATLRSRRRSITVAELMR